MTTAVRGDINLWDADTGHERASLTVDAFNARRFEHMVDLIFSQDGRTLMASISDGTIQMWRAAFPGTAK